MQFRNLVENRSGVIAVDNSEAVFGGGVYDGHFNTEPVNDTNGIFRAYAFLWAAHKTAAGPDDRAVVGSWAQVIANSNRVEDFTIVEINPGYLPLIRERAGVRSLLRNPKVHIVIDDGRRWLISHPDRRFDFIVMNTTFNWRANASNLLSTEFLSLIQSHLAPGGIAYYNTTWSKDVIATGASAFPYALRIGSFVAVSDRPFSLDKDRWKAALVQYQIDGDLPRDSESLNNMLRHADEMDLSGAAIGLPNGMVESRTHILERCRRLPHHHR